MTREGPRDPSLFSGPLERMDIQRCSPRLIGCDKCLHGFVFF